MSDTFANTVLDLEQLRDAIARNLTQMPSVERFLAPLDGALTKIRSLSTLGRR